jgi:hypothetical protein
MQGRERRVRALAAQIAVLSARDRAVLADGAEILKKVIAAI